MSPGILDTVFPSHYLLEAGHAWVCASLVLMGHWSALPCGLLTPHLVRVVMEGVHRGPFELE